MEYSDVCINTTLSFVISSTFHNSGCLFLFHGLFTEGRWIERRVVKELDGYVLHYAMHLSSWNQF